MSEHQQDINQIIASAVNARVETLLNRLLENAIQEQTKAVVAEEVRKSADAIRAEVRAALEQSIGVISDSLVDGFVASAEGRYPSIEVNFRAG